VLAILRAAGARRVADLGCGEGALTAQLLADRQFTEVIAADVSSRALEVAERRLRLDRMPDRQRSRLRLIQSSLTYRDQRLAGLDALVLVEVVEHVDPSRLGALERTVFGAAAAGLVVVTTPNAEYNVRYDFLAPGAMRHRDHRFEWTRAEFTSWAGRVAAEHGYQVAFHPVGDDDPEVGPPTQLAVFSAASAAAAEVTP
jgi:3' terminal RNA ribose 2'-O-methyltransferase Hen1